MGIVLESLLCALVGSLIVSSWFLGPLIVAAKDYFFTKASYYRTLEFLKKFEEKK